MKSVVFILLCVTIAICAVVMRMGTLESRWEEEEMRK